MDKPITNSNAPSTEPLSCDVLIKYNASQPTEFHEYLICMLMKMFETINECPLDETIETLSHSVDEKVPNMRAQFGTICEEFMEQLDNFGRFRTK